MTLTLRPPRRTRAPADRRAPPRRLRLSDPDPAGASSLSRKQLARLGALLLMATGLLFCHGCHGDEDDELSLFFPRLQNERRERSDLRPLPPALPATQWASGWGTSIGAGLAISPMGSAALGLRGSVLNRSRAICRCRRCISSPLGSSNSPTVTMLL